MDKPNNRLIVPSCAGVLDCFNTRITRFYQKESMCCLQGEVDNLLMLGLFSFIYLNCNMGSGSTYIFKMADFKKYLSYSGGSKSRDLCTGLTELQNGTYLWNYENCGPVLQIEFSSGRRLVTVESIYFQKIYQHMASLSGKYDKWGRKVESGVSTYSSLLESSILKERNVGSVEMAIELCKLVERRGPLKEGECAHISTLGLMDRCPTLSHRIEKIKENKEVNRIIKCDLEKCLALLHKRTSLYDTFSDLKIVLPSKIAVQKDCIIKIIYLERMF